MWYYKDTQINSINDIPIENSIGFIYCITHKETGKFYIGKKNLQSITNKKLGKKEIKLQEQETKNIRGRKPTKKTVIAESNWLIYTGSCIELNNLIKKEGRDNFIFEILKFCISKKQLSYNEIKYQILNECLEYPENTWNGNILGKYFKTDV